MNLLVQSTTLKEVRGETGSFPHAVRDPICQALGQISMEQLQELLSRHESDKSNFDSWVEKSLREIAPSLTIRRNYRVSTATKFNHDLLIETGDDIVCLEIEKGYTSRFELDILKMQASCGVQQSGNPDARVFGAFIVPSDNLVARHIYGNSRESSFKYLTRLFRLVSQTEFPDLEDILLVGYGAKEMNQPKKSPSKRKSAEQGTGKRIRLPQALGLRSDEEVKTVFAAYPLKALLAIRLKLLEGCPSLREKINPNTRYLGYARGTESDSLYIYVQKSRLLVDVKIPADSAARIEAQGFAVHPRNNFQGRQGWLTGLRIPHDTDKIDEASNILLEALQK